MGTFRWKNCYADVKRWRQVERSIEGWNGGRFSEQLGNKLICHGNSEISQERAVHCRGSSALLRMDQQAVSVASPISNRPITIAKSIA